MRKLAFTIVLTLFSLLTAYSETLLVENFGYTIGLSVTNDSSEWFLPYGGSSVYSITNGLSFPNYVESGVGNAVLLDQKVSNDHPHHPFAEQVSGSVYVAFMFQPSIVSKAGYFFTLRDNQVAGNSVFNYNGRVFVNESYQLGLSFADSQKAVYSAVPLDPQKPHLVVLRYDIVDGANNDQVYLYAFSDECPSDEPAAPLIGPLSDPAKTDINPAHIVLRGYENDGWLVIGGIRVATSFREAARAVNQTNIESLPAEQPSALIYYEGRLIIRRCGHYYSLAGQLLF